MTRSRRRSRFEVKNRGTKLTTIHHIQARVDELVAKAAAKAGVTINRIVAELAKSYVERQRGSSPCRFLAMKRLLSMPATAANLAAVLIIAVPALIAFKYFRAGTLVFVVLCYVV
jgi:hypothetical protein